MKLSVIFLVGILILLLIAYLELVFSYEFGLSLFYLIPVALVSWYSGKNIGLFFSCLAASLWFYMDYYSGHHYEHQYAMLWNTVVRLGIFMIVSLLIYRINQEMKKSVRSRSK